MSISNVSYSTQVVYGYQSSATNKSAAPRNAGANEQVQGERQKTANPVAQDTAAGRSKFDSVQAAIDDIYKAAKDGAFGPLGETIMSGVENIIQGATSLSPNGSNITYGPKPNITHGSNNGALGYHGDDLDRVLTHLQNNFGMSADQAKKWLAAAGSLSTTNTNGYSGVGNSRNNGAPLPSGIDQAAIDDIYKTAKAKDDALRETIMSGVESIIQGATSLSPNGSNITYGPKPNITHGPNNGDLGYHGDDLDRVLTHLQNNFGMSADQAKKWLGSAGSLSTTNTNGYSGVGNSRNNGAPLPEDMRSSQSNLNASGSKKNSFVDVLV